MRNRGPVGIPKARTASLSALEREIISCERCPRLREWCEHVALVRVRRYAAEEYWGRPVPGFGDPMARLLVVGLAPGAHGANRTGRVFTGDRSGDFLFAALHRAGFANQPESRDRKDGLRLLDAWVAALVRCAPPANKPTHEEIASCRTFVLRELSLLPNLRMILALGRIAMDGAVSVLRDAGRLPRGRAFAFGHGIEHEVDARLRLVASYHPSQQNTFTGRLTAASFDAVLRRVSRLLEDG